DGQIRLRRRAEVIEGVEESITGFCHKRPAVITYTGDRLGDPRGVACKQLVIFRRAQKSDNSQLNDEVVHNFLCLRFRNCPGFEVAFEKDVEERRNTAERHSSAVLLFDGRQVCEIEPLNGFTSISGWNGDIEAITLSHLLQFF